MIVTLLPRDGTASLTTPTVKENVKAADEDRLLDSELLAQMKCVLPDSVYYRSADPYGRNSSTFIFAGMDTTSNALSRILHLLCQHQDVQDKLRTEIRAAIEQYGLEIPYDELSALPYLDAVCRETLRL